MPTSFPVSLSLSFASSFRKENKFYRIWDTIVYTHKMQNDLHTWNWRPFECLNVYLSVFMRMVDECDGKKKTNGIYSIPREKLTKAKRRKNTPEINGGNSDNDTTTKTAKTSKTTILTILVMNVFKPTHMHILQERESKQYTRNRWKTHTQMQKKKNKKKKTTNNEENKQITNKKKMKNYNNSHNNTGSQLKWKKWTRIS